MILFLSHKLFSHWIFAMTDVQGIESFKEVTGIDRQNSFEGVCWNLVVVTFIVITFIVITFIVVTLY